MTVHTSTCHTVVTGRARIDEIDAQIVRLVQERTAVSEQVQQARQADGGPRVAHARENEVVGRWRTALGRPGGAIALALLELGRGRPA
jgi:chorismate mutase